METPEDNPFELTEHVEKVLNQNNENNMYENNNNQNIESNRVNSNSNINNSNNKSVVCCNNLHCEKPSMIIKCGKAGLEINVLSGQSMNRLLIVIEVK